MFDWLTDLFKGSSSTGATAPTPGGGDYSWIGPLISAIGSTASKAKWTPREDATQEEIDKANRNNMLMSLLGTAAQAYGGYREQQGMTGLAEALKTGQMTSTTPQGAAQISQADRILDYGIKNPEFAKTAIGIAQPMQTAESEQRAKMIQALMKSAKRPGLYEESQLSQMGKNYGLNPQELSDFIREGKQKLEAEADAQDASRRSMIERLYPGVMPSISAPTTTQPVTAPTRTGGSIEDMVGQIANAARQSKDVDIKIPAAQAGMASEIMKGLEQQGFNETYGQYQQPQDLIQKAQQREQKKTTQNETKDLIQTVKSNKAYNDLVTKTIQSEGSYQDLLAQLGEIQKRGKFTQQDKIALAKLAQQFLEPGLAVREAEVENTFAYPQQWKNSTWGKAWMKLTGEPGVNFENVGMLLKGARAMLKERQNAAQAFLQNEVETYRGLFSDDALDVLSRQYQKRDYDQKSDKILQGLEEMGLGTVPIRGVTPKAPATPSFTPTPAPAPTPKQVMINGRPMIIEGRF